MNDQRQSTTWTPKANGDPLHHQLDQTSCDLDGGYRASVDRLKATGQFSKDQIRLIEDEFRIHCLHDDAYNCVTSLKRGDHIGKYRIEKLLGRGGEGFVFQVRDPDRDAKLAIKILHNLRSSERFHREMKMVLRLAHPNIVTAYEIAEFQGLPFIAMELMCGPDLNALVQDKGPIGWQQASRYILQIANALSHAHCRELIHRDVKPGNIILNSSGQVKLVDLGLASMEFFDPSSEETQLLHITREAHVAGTLAYMSPEQAHSLAAANAQSDIYSLGATWYHLLTGKPRLRGKSFSKQFKNLLVKRRFRALPDETLPDPLRDIYRRMVAYDPKNRPENCRDVAGDITQALLTLGEKNVASDQISILIVEDSQTDMQRAIGLLRRMNESLRIHEATTLQGGIESFDKLQPDLVLLDLTLPDSSGVKTVERFRAAAPKVPIVVLSGAHERDIEVECIVAGANDFVSKGSLSVHNMERVIFVTHSRHNVGRSG